MMVYGSERFESIIEKSCYSFRNVLVESKDNTVTIVKVFRTSTVSKHKAIKVPPEVDSEAQSLFTERSHYYTAETSAQKTPTDAGGSAAVSFRGTTGVKKVSCLNLTEHVRFQQKRGTNVDEIQTFMLSTGVKILFMKHSEKSLCYCSTCTLD